MSLPKKYKDRIKLYFQRFIHKLPTNSHKQVVAEQYALRNKVFYSEDFRSVQYIQSLLYDIYSFNT
jgi:hypothetical protein